MNVTITIDRTTVFDQVARTTGYAGAKLLDRDEHAYERLSTTDADEAMLERFWKESCDCLCMALRRLIEAEGMEADHYRMDLCLSEAFDEALLPSVTSGAESYLVNAVTSRWMALVDRDKAAEHTAAASLALADLRHKVLCKRPPRRPEYRRIGNR